MNIESAIFLQDGSIEIDVGGDIRVVPGDPNNRHRIAIQEWIQAGNSVVPFTALPPTANDVRLECQRRLIAMFGARNNEHLRTLVSDGERESIRLLLIGEANWTAEQSTRSLVLAGADTAMETVLGFSSTLKAMAPIPADYTDDKYWS